MCSAMTWVIPPVLGGDRSVHRPGQARGLRWAGPADPFSLVDLARRGPMQPDPDIAMADARTANDFPADIIKEHPQRFAGLAAIPLQDPPKAAAELRRAVELGLCGALVNDHMLGHYLDELACDVRPGQVRRKDCRQHTVDHGAASSAALAHR
jgi:hypothetical protein